MPVPVSVQIEPKIFYLGARMWWTWSLGLLLLCLLLSLYSCREVAKKEPISHSIVSIIQEGILP